MAQEAALQSLATKLQQAEWEARAYADKEAPLQMQAQQARAIPAPTPPPATPAPAPSPPPHRRHQRQASPWPPRALGPRFNTPAGARAACAADGGSQGGARPDLERAAARHGSGQGLGRARGDAWAARARHRGVGQAPGRAAERGAISRDLPSGSSVAVVTPLALGLAASAVPGRASRGGAGDARGDEHQGARPAPPPPLPPPPYHRAATSAPAAPSPRD